MNTTYVVTVIYIRNKITCQMENFHVLIRWRFPNTPSPPDLVRWSNPHPGDPASLRWMKSLWDREFVVMFPRLILIFFLQLTEKKFQINFSNLYILPFPPSATSKLSIYIYIIVHSRQTQLAPPPVFPPIVYHLFFPLHVFPRLLISLKPYSIKFIKIKMFQ